MRSGTLEQKAALLMRLTQKMMRRRRLRLAARTPLCNAGVHLPYMRLHQPACVVPHLPWQRHTGFRNNNGSASHAWCKTSLMPPDGRVSWWRREEKSGGSITPGWIFNPSPTWIMMSDRHRWDVWKNTVGLEDLFNVIMILDVFVAIKHE